MSTHRAALAALLLLTPLADYGPDGVASQSELAAAAAFARPAEAAAAVAAFDPDTIVRGASFP